RPRSWSLPNSRPSTGPAPGPLPTNQTSQSRTASKSSSATACSAQYTQPWRIFPSSEGSSTLLEERLLQKTAPRPNLANRSESTTSVHSCSRDRSRQTSAQGRRTPYSNCPPTQNRNPTANHYSPHACMHCSADFLACGVAPTKTARRCLRASHLGPQ